MPVKNTMALMKLCLILACTNSWAQSWEFPKPNPNSGESALGSAWLIGKILETRMNKQDTAYHTQAVYHALNNLENGDLVEWFNERTGSHGKARIIYTWPSNSGPCRRVYSWARFGDQMRTYEDTACYNNTRNTWNFIDKY